MEFRGPVFAVLPDMYEINAHFPPFVWHVFVNVSGPEVIGTLTGVGFGIHLSRADACEGQQWRILMMNAYQNTRFVT